MKFSAWTRQSHPSPQDLHGGARKWAWEVDSDGFRLVGTAFVSPSALLADQRRAPFRSFILTLLFSLSLTTSQSKYTVSSMMRSAFLGSRAAARASSSTLPSLPLLMTSRSCK